LHKLNKDTFLSEINNNGEGSKEVWLKSYCQQDLDIQNAANVTVVTAVL